MLTPHPRLTLAALLLAAAFSNSCAWLNRAPVAYVISEHGAVGDGTTVNTKAIQGTIDACSAAGGGVIIVPKGVFISGALYFKPGVNLEIEKDAVLKSTTSMADFPPLYTSWEGNERYWTSAFLNFIGGKDVVVSGEGTVDGSGLAWPGGGRGRQRPPGPRRTPPTARIAADTEPLPMIADVYPMPLPTTDAINFAPDPAHLPVINAAGIRMPGGGGSRLSPPRAIVFQNCSNVRISGLHLINPGRWGYVFIYCENVVAENLTMRTDQYIPSSDGIDVCSSKNVRISGCNIACNDDNISIKAGKDADGLRVHRPTENVEISDCVFGVGGGVAMGSEVSGGIHHVVVERCKFTDTSAAVRIKSQPSRGGVIDDVVYRDIQVTNVGRAIEFDLEWRLVPPLEPAAKVLTVLRNVRVSNLTGTAQTVGIIQGYPESPAEGFVFENCHLTAQKGLVLTNVRDVDLSGLSLQVAQGDPIIRQNAAAQP